MPLGKVLCNRIACSLISTTRRLVLVYQSYLSTKTHLTIRESGIQFGHSWRRKCIMFLTFPRTKQHNSRRINHKTFITWTKLIERMQELDETLRVHNWEKFLTNNWRAAIRSTPLESKECNPYNNEPPYHFSYGLNSTTTVLLQGWLWH